MRYYSSAPHICVALHGDIDDNVRANSEMKRRAGIFNPKRRIAPIDGPLRDWCMQHADAAIYEGNPQHKCKPNDHALTPPFAPRPGKALCDAEGEFPVRAAQALLRDGLKRCMTSVRWRGEWPQNVWAVKNGVAFEAEVTNIELGTYHGYPILSDDDLRIDVLKEWQRRA